MPFFYQFQRVRIVNAKWDDDSFPEMVGQECTLMAPVVCWVDRTTSKIVPAWSTNLRHPKAPWSAYCVLESMIEPLQFDFDKEREEEENEELQEEECLVHVRQRELEHLLFDGRQD